MRVLWQHRIDADVPKSPAFQKKCNCKKGLKRRLSGTLAVPIPESRFNLKPNSAALNYTGASVCVTIGPELFSVSPPLSKILKAIFKSHLF